jgi:hypothetical protein
MINKQKVDNSISLINLIVTINESLNIRYAPSFGICPQTSKDVELLKNYQKFTNLKDRSGQIRSMTRKFSPSFDDFKSRSAIKEASKAFNFDSLEAVCSKIEGTFLLFEILMKAKFNKENDLEMVSSSLALMMLFETVETFILKQEPSDAQIVVTMDFLNAIYLHCLLIVFRWIPEQSSPFKIDKTQLHKDFSGENMQKYIDIESQLSSCFEWVCIQHIED